MTAPLPYALGRHVEHDEQSRAYPAMVAAVKTKTVDWPISVPALDQGQLGACTGFALTQWLNTDYARVALTNAGRHHVPFTEADAVQFYRYATRLDNIPGHYPPTDTGSSGLAVCKAGKSMGLLSGYRHAFGFQAMLMALQHSPVIVGTTWTRDMFTPDRRHGIIRNTGEIVGGHEYLVLGANLERGLVHIRNSWGPSWGIRGDAYIPFSSFMLLLADQGDCTVPVL